MNYSSNILLNSKNKYLLDFLNSFILFIAAENSHLLKNEVEFLNVCSLYNCFLITLKAVYIL